MLCVAILIEKIKTIIDIYGFKGYEENCKKMGLKYKSYFIDNFWTEKVFKDKDTYLNDEKIALEKLGWEYLDDYFCSRNEDKMRLAKMTFSYRKDKHNNPIITYRRIINIEKSENKKLRDLKTHWGEGFVTFHHKILESHFSKIDLFDASTWLKNKGSCASEYYKYFLGLFLCHGVLFEDFVTNRVEKEFFEGVVYPAFNFLEKEFGLRPLIVHLRPKEYEDFKFWWGYKEEIKNTLDCTDTQSDMIQSDRIFVTSREG